MPNATLLRTSCLSASGLHSLPDKSVDLIVTDPPYAEYVHDKVRSGTRIGQRTRSTPGQTGISAPVDLGFAHLSQRTMTLCARQFARVCRRWVLIFADEMTGNDWVHAGEAAGLEHIRTGWWIKEGGSPQFTGDRPAIPGEVIVILHPPGKKRWHGGGKPARWPYPVASDNKGEQRIHPTQKPVGLIEALLRDFSDKDELICDPFAGSASTGVAAVHLGRRFLGMERDRACHKKAMARLGLAREQLGLFGEGEIERPSARIRHSFADVEAEMESARTEPDPNDQFGIVGAFHETSPFTGDPASVERPPEKDENGSHPPSTVRADGHSTPAGDAS